AIRAGARCVTRAGAGEHAPGGQGAGRGRAAACRAPGSELQLLACADEHWPALSWPGALVGGPARPDRLIEAMVGGRGNRLTANALEAAVVVVEVSDREDARGFDSGRFALLVDLSCGGERPAADPRKVRGSPARPLGGDSRWLREP